MKNNLPDYRWKYPGVILIAAGLVFTLLYLLTNFTIYFPAFAVVSSFLETKFFITVRTNLADELLMLCLVSGLAMIAFSCEKNEQRRFMTFRYKALWKAFRWNTALLLFSVVFIYGQGFIIVLSMNLVSVFVLYLVFFYKLRYR